MMKMQTRYGVVLAGMAMLAGSLWLLEREPAASRVPDPTPIPQRTSVPTPTLTASTGITAAVSARGESTARELVRQKYRLLLADVPAATHGSLLAALVAREAARETTDLNDDVQSEREVSLHLPLELADLYQQLLDSDTEQQELVRFAQHVADTAPLTNDQLDALLHARLRHKPAVQELELQLLPLASRPAMEQSYLQDVAGEGLQHQSHAFLEEARAFLTDEQWFALAHLETQALAQRLTAASRN